MENNQQNKPTPEHATPQGFSEQNQPGQQLPRDSRTEEHQQAHGPTESERHSESSMPEDDNETLGTP